MNETDFEKLYDHAASILRMSWDSIHGPGHWRRVEDTVKLIAPPEGADLTVGRLFAIYHDSCRINDGADLDHGLRAASLLRNIVGFQFTLDRERLDVLIFAVTHHAEGRISSDPTIGMCWDADRLDLGRIGIIPSLELMSTSAGKEIALAGSRLIYMKRKGIPTSASRLRAGRLGESRGSHSA